VTSIERDDKTDADRTPGHLLVACDKFKGTLSTREVATCIAPTVRAQSCQELALSSLGLSCCWVTGWRGGRGKCS